MRRQWGIIYHGVLSDGVGAQQRGEGAGRANPASCLRMKSRTAERASSRICSPRHGRYRWPRVRPPEDRCPTWGGKGWRQANVLCCVQKVLFHYRALCELSNNGITESKLRTLRPMRLCARGSGKDIVNSNAFLKTSLFSNYIPLRAGIRHVVNHEQQWGPL